MVDTGGDAIPSAMQLIAGRTAQEHNLRKGRKGAFWEDRYHATAVQTGDHLARCMVYIDMNMVRAGVVDHPREWPHGGYPEVQRPPRRYAVIDMAALQSLFGSGEPGGFAAVHRQWVDAALAGTRASPSGREPWWSESLAVGSEAFVEGVRTELGVKAYARSVAAVGDVWRLKEPSGSYNAHLWAQKSHLSSGDTIPN